MKTALCYNLKFSVRTYLTSHQEGHLFLVPNIHNLAILSFTERQTATHSPSCIVPIMVLYKAMKKISIQLSQFPLFYSGPFCLIYCPGCVGIRMRVHVVAVHFVALTVVIAADPEMLSGISCSVPETHIESNLNKAFNFLFYYLLANLPFQNWRHGICFVAGRKKWIPNDRS